MDKLNLSKLTTEAANKDETSIETLSIEQLFHKMNEEDKKVSYTVEKVISQIAIVVEAAIHTIRNGGRLLYAGAGTSH